MPKISSTKQPISSLKKLGRAAESPIRTRIFVNSKFKGNKCVKGKQSRAMYCSKEGDIYKVLRHRKGKSSSGRRLTDKEGMGLDITENRFQILSDIEIGGMEVTDVGIDAQEDPSRHNQSPLNGNRGPRASGGHKVVDRKNKGGRAEDWAGERRPQCQQKGACLSKGKDIVEGEDSGQTYSQEVQDYIMEDMVGDQITTESVREAVHKGSNMVKKLNVLNIVDKCSDLQKALQQNGVYGFLPITDLDSTMFTSSLEANVILDTETFDPVKVHEMVKNSGAYNFQKLSFSCLLE